MAVLGIGNRHGVKVLFCTADGEREFPVLEVPEWMFDPVVCGRLEREEMPRVDCRPLRELQVSLDSVRLAKKEIVLEDQHDSRVVRGADAKEIEVQSVRVVPTDLPDSGGAAKGSSEDDSYGGADAVPARRPRWRSPDPTGRR